MAKIVASTKKPQARRIWSKDDLRLLGQEPVAKIAKALKRTTGATRHKWTPPGESDVISHVKRLSSNETKIAPRLVRKAVGSSN